MKKIIFLLVVVFMSPFLFAQNDYDYCNCPDSEWSTFAYLIKEVNQILPKKVDFTNQNIFGYSTDWEKGETDFFNSVYVKNPVEYLYRKTDSLEIVSSEYFLILENKDSIDIYDIKEEGNADDRKEEVRKKGQIEKKNLDVEKNPEKTNTSNNDKLKKPFEINSRIKKSKKTRFFYIKKIRRHKKYKGKCPKF